jgi:hypothetical protein
MFLALWTIFQLSSFSCLRNTCVIISYPRRARSCSLLFYQFTALRLWHSAWTRSRFWIASLDDVSVHSLRPQLTAQACNWERRRRRVAWQLPRNDSCVLPWEKVISSEPFPPSSMETTPLLAVSSWASFHRDTRKPSICGEHERDMPYLLLLQPGAVSSICLCIPLP